MTAGNADGIGYMLLGSGIGASDLDHCRDADTGALERGPKRCSAEAAGAYQEITVSGGGLRIIGTASGPEAHRKFTFDRKTGAGIELYRNTARYITVSGLEIGECSRCRRSTASSTRCWRVHRTAGAGWWRSTSTLPGRQARAIDYDSSDPERRAGRRAQRTFSRPSSGTSPAKGWSAEQIIDELAKHPNGIAAKYADRLLAEVTPLIRANGARASARQ